MTNIVHKKNDETLNSRYAYDYDDAGQRKWVKRANGNGDVYKVCQRCHASQHTLAMDSVQAQALADGNREAAVCSDCHTAHAVQDWVDEETGETLPSMRPVIPQTCAKCHSAIYETYLTSVHGSALTEENNPDVPTCIDCHGVHNIEDPRTAAFRLQSPQMCAECHTDPSIMSKYGISTHVLDTDVADFHGTTVMILEQQSPDAETNKPVCYDCHGIHDIKRADDPEKGLQFASRNFYVSFLAALEIEKDPAKFFGVVERQAPRQELIVELPDYMRVDTLEKAFGVSRSTLQAYNPALLPPVWEGAKYVPRGFRLRLPSQVVIEAAPEQVLDAVPESQRFAGQVPDRTHKVKRGDTLSGIAKRYGTTVTKLAQANGLRSTSRIRIGQVLKLPVRGPGASVTAAAAGEPSPAPALKPSAAEKPAPPAPAAAPEAATTASLPGGEAAGTTAPAADPSNYLVADNDTVEVQAAETLTHYAGWLEVSTEDLRQANGWSRQRSLVLGERVRVVFGSVSREAFGHAASSFTGTSRTSFSRATASPRTPSIASRPGNRCGWCEAPTGPGAGRCGSSAPGLPRAGRGRRVAG